MKPFVIAICHQKGGVAKTTTASSLGAWFAESGNKVMLIDLDPSANLTAGFGVNPIGVQRSAADVLLGNENFTNVSSPSGIPKLDIVSSNREMNTVSQFLSVRSGYQELIRRHVSSNGMSEYDYVIMDCPPSLGALAVSALSAADLAIIPTQCEYYSIQALNMVFKIINRVRNEFNPNLSYRLLVTMYDQRGNLHKNVFEKLRAHYENLLFETVIGFDSKFRASQIAGVPITEYAAQSRGAKQYLELTKEISAYVE